MTAAAGSKLRDNLVVRDDGDRLPNYLIKEIKETSVIIDLNHPLAGKNLYFDVKVLDVEAPKK